MSHIDFDILNMEFTLDCCSLAFLSGDIRISSLCYINSTNSYVRIYKQIMQNKPNFLHFSLENEGYAKKQSQFKPKQSQFWPITGFGKSKTKPIPSKAKTNDFTWITGLIIILERLLTEFTTLKVANLNFFLSQNRPKVHYIARTRILNNF